VLTVPTVILEAGTPDGIEAVMTRHGWRAVVMKPEFGASAHDTRLVTDRTVAEATAALGIGEIRRPLMIQPFVEEIQSRGEWSLVFIDSEFTHAVLKRPAAGDFRVQPRLGGTVQAAAPPDGVRAAARAALAALPRAALYARIDGVETPEGFLVVEVEVNEPGLFFTHAPPAAERLAEALLRAL
jgi:glutathione synthase/RimK-type ligase-like ATP-grasp enzyme